MDKGGKVASIIENHVQGQAVGERSQGLFDAPVVLLLGLALPRVDGNASGSDAEINS